MCQRTQRYIDKQCAHRVWLLLLFLLLWMLLLLLLVFRLDPLLLLLCIPGLLLLLGVVLPLMWILLLTEVRVRAGRERQCMQQDKQKEDLR